METAILPMVMTRAMTTLFSIMRATGAAFTRSPLPWVQACA